MTHSDNGQWLIVKYTLGVGFTIVFMIFAGKIIGLFYVYATQGQMAKDIGEYIYKIIGEIPGGVGSMIKWFAEHRNVY